MKSITRPLVLALVAAVLVPAGAGADDPMRCDRSQAWRDPLLPDFDRSRVETLTLDGEKLNVLLPPGYHDEGNDRRYPVVYVHHGGGWGPEQGPDLWLAATPLIELTEAEPHVIAVLPYGGTFGFYSDWRDRSQAWETYHQERVIPFIDGSYRTVARRSHRAAIGESMGGLGSLQYAGRHPDTYAAVGAFTGGVDTDLLAPVLTSGMLPVGFGCAGSGSTGGLWGEPGVDDIWRRAHNPGDLALNYGNTTLYSFAASGRPCDLDDVTEIVAHEFAAFEAALRPGSDELSAKLTRAGVAHTYDAVPCGMHSFRYISAALIRAWPLLTGAFGAPRPRSFDLRRVEPVFGAYGWRFTADPVRAPEFLTVADASCRGVGLTGSGVTEVRTRRCFRPGSTVDLFGAREATATADRRGRIRFSVDLGPAHEHQEGSPAARALEAAGGYWTSKVVTMRRAG